MANKMAEKNKNASQQMVAPKPKSRSVPKPQEKEVKPVRRESKSQSKAAPTWQARLRANRTARFVLDAYYELRYKVTWPSRRDAWNMTVAVIAISLIIGLFLGLVDLGLTQLFLLISGGR